MISESRSCLSVTEYRRSHRMIAKWLDIILLASHVMLAEPESVQKRNERGAVHSSRVVDLEANGGGSSLCFD